MKRHRAAVLQDACTKQYDCAVEAARQVGHGELKEVFTAEERKRARLDGGFEEDGRQRHNVEVVPAGEPAHVLRERDMAMTQARAMRHPYRGMPLTGAPPSRFPLYLSPRWFCRFPKLDENGHAPETLDPGEQTDAATEGHERCETGWIDPEDLYITSSDGSVVGFRKPDGKMASREELQEDARRWSFNFAVDVRFCQTYNHSHECKPTCFKNSEHKKPSTDAAATAKDAPRSACRFRFWCLILIGLRLLRRMGKALVPEPYVAADADENNEYGRCKVRRENSFRGSSNDMCQACLRCNVDLQYQMRTFPLAECGDRAGGGASADALRAARGIASPSAAEHGAETAAQPSAALPTMLKRLAGRAGAAKDAARDVLSSFAVAMRSSHVADFYATKYLAKPQQWLANVLGPLITGFRRVEEEKAQREEPLSTKAQAMRNVRAAIFAANRSVWISCCEASLYIRTNAAAVQTHGDVVVHGRKGLFMMHECKRILNGEVAGTGLWEAELGTSSEAQGEEVLRVGAAGGDVLGDQSEQDSQEDPADAAERSGESSAEEEASDTERASAAESAADQSAAEEASDAAARHAPEQPPAQESSAEAGNKDVQIFHMTISLRDNWLHRGEALNDMDIQTYAELIERVAKPVAGSRVSDKVLQQHVFAFDGHYKMSAGYIQVLRTGRDRRVARFNLPNCVRENVNEGEENAQFKAFHCSLLRCPGPGHCADPLMCASMLFPNKDGRFCFRSSWRARESEIFTLALRGLKKKTEARRLETIFDSTLCKVYTGEAGSGGGAADSVLQSTTDKRPAGGGAEGVVRERRSKKILQVVLQQFFRQLIRRHREAASAQAPCTYGYPERVISLILNCDSLDMDIWHAEQLSLAEFQALQQFEFLFNLTLSTDAKNLAVEKLKAHKKSSAAEGEATLEHEPVQMLNAGEELADIVGDLEPLPPLEEVVEGATLEPVTDEATILRLLQRTEMVELARRPGQGRREGAQNMREASDAFGVPQHLRADGREVSKFGASEHDRQAALAQHRECLERLRAQAEHLPAEGEAGEAAAAQPQEEEREADVTIVTEDGEDLSSLGPVAYAKKLCDRASLTLEQRGPVALIAREMQIAFEAEQERRAKLTEQQRQALANEMKGQALLPLAGPLMRMLIFGGGGCGKTRIIVEVLRPLFRRFYGPRGCVCTAFSNKAARLVKGKTSHALVKMRGGQSLTMARLRIKDDKDQRALAAVWAPLGALIKDEFSMQAGILEHAIAVRAIYGRERAHQLKCDDYARPETNYASIPFVLTSGDPLQFPPVPATASLLANSDGASKERERRNHPAPCEAPVKTALADGHKGRASICTVRSYPAPCEAPLKTV